MKVLIFGTGIITDIIFFICYIFILKTSLNFEHARTIVFTAFAVSSLLFAFSIKSIKKSLFQIDLFSNIWLVVSVVLSLFAQLLVIYTPIMQDLFKAVPLNLIDWSIIIPLSLIKIIGIEITKKYFLHNKKV